MAKFSKAHCEALAACVADAKRHAGPENDDECALVHSGIDDVARRIADMLHAEMGWDRNGNRRFRRDRFLAACGVTDGD